MKSAAAILSALFALSSCTAIDRPQMSSFEPNADGTFRYEVMKGSSDSIYNDADRLKWLQMYLDDNALCPNGYKITEKKNVLIQKSFIGDAYRQIIYGRCT